ncbi:hypothetical protein LQ948_12930 [Jiella sp. MQZ9-1]|uniref:Uncharacterized protein n=1 Tax=Jiella flava TaxID=2816857 RepID=A0A939FZF4_9HYPH|nr:hypothetical protein [Jiella flava]MBO0663541.1 hypothetical protein [Jiella flava]MCD2472116.1 hypothetical protein [Jiella flava]
MSVDGIVALPGRFVWELLKLLGELAGDLVVAAKAHPILAICVLLAFLTAMVLSRGSALLILVLGFIAVAALIGADPVREVDKRQAFTALSILAMLLIGFAMRQQRRRRHALEDEIAALEDSIEDARRDGWQAGQRYRPGEDGTPRLDPPE